MSGKFLHRIGAFWKRVPPSIAAFLSGAPRLDPEQQARLEQMEKDYEAFVRRKEATPPNRSTDAPARNDSIEPRLNTDAAENATRGKPQKNA